MGQQLKILVALPEDLGLLPELTRQIATIYNFNSRDSDVLF